MSTSPETLVIGGTGKTGRRVAARLAARGVPVRIGSRTATPAFDWEDRRTWGPALDGARAVYIAYYPDLAVPGAAEAAAEVARLAAERGVERIVLLSGRGEPEAQRAERLVAEAGVPWTVVRCSWFAQNFSESFFAEEIRAGVLAAPAGYVREPFVDVEDIADVAEAALTEDGHAGKVYELTGPRLLSFADAVADIAAATGREISYVPVEMDAYAAELADHDVPRDMIALLRFLFTEVLDGRNASLADGVQRALGRPPRDFRDYARDAAAAGAWEPGVTAGR